MSNLITVIDADLPPTGLSISRMDLVPSAGNSEFLASAHWLFGETGNMLDIKSNRPLCRQMMATLTSGGSGYTVATVTASDGSTWVAKVTAGAVTEVKCTLHTSGDGVPTLTIAGDGTGAAATVTRGLVATQGASSITIPPKTGIGNGLIAQGINDSSSETLCVVFRKSADVGGHHMIFATADSTVPTAGSMFWRSNANDGMFVRARGMDAAAVSIGAGGAAGSWVFAAISYKPVTGRQYRLSNGSTGSTSGSKTANNVEVALGNAWVASYNSAAALEIAEFITFPLPLTNAEMAKVYARSKARLAALATPITVP